MNTLNSVQGTVGKIIMVLWCPLTGTVLSLSKIQYEVLYTFDPCAPKEEGQGEEGER